jgi:hypothetical protein
MHSILNGTTPTARDQAAIAAVNLAVSLLRDRRDTGMSFSVHYFPRTDAVFCNDPIARFAKFFSLRLWVFAGALSTGSAEARSFV